MELANDFTVDVPIEEAWQVLTDLEQVAPCMPGAELREVDGDDYHGVVKVKVGPITAEYKGKVTFVERDEGAHRAVLRAQGRETRGQGQASATITAVLEPAEASTRVSVVTDLTITGKVAQLGRGVLADVSNKLMSQFAESLGTSLLNARGAAGDGAPAKTPPDGPAAEGDGKGPATAATEQIDAGWPATAPVDLARVAGPPVLIRVLPIFVLLAAVCVGLLLARRRWRSGSGPAPL